VAVLNVAAIIVTRGDQDLAIRERILPSLPEEWEWHVWDNEVEEDLAVYGRYAAIQWTDAELIYVQDDDCVVSDPRAIVDAWREWHGRGIPNGHVVCNMPQEFRHDFYEDHALVGFGAAFHRDAPQRAFARFFGSDTGNLITRDLQHYYRCCDVVFTGLTPRVLVDVPYENLPHAFYETRMWKQPEHQAERARMLDLVRQLA
jgi:hypothetical protein